MDAELDRLQIQVEGDSQTAASGLDRLTASLTQLKSAAKGGAGLTSTVNQLTKLSSALTSLGNMPGLQNLATALAPLQSVEKAAGFNSVVNALKKIPQITEQLKSTDLGDFATQISRVTAAVAPLATEMEKVSRGFAAFPIRIQKIIASSDGLNVANKKLSTSFAGLNAPITAAIAKLTAYGYILRRVVTFLADCVTSINEYVENVNLFQVSMGEFYAEAYDYAQLVSDKLGIDPSEWMRTQGVFMSMAKGFGVSEDQAYALSEGLTELSYDLSSLYNEDIDSSVQRLQSALAGEIEPIRRLGISISEATLKEYALSRGIDESVESMTEQEKALLRSLKLMEGSANIGAIGDFAKTLESPANALRVLNQQIEQFKRAIGSVLLPVIVQVLPYVQAVTEILTELISALAVFVGFTMPEWDATDWGSGVTAGAGAITDAAGSATDAMKELKNATMGIDELNIISPPDAGSGAGAGLGANWAAGLEIPDVWDKEAIAAIQTKADALKETLRPIVTAALGVAAALAAWKIGSSVVSGLNTIRTVLDSIFGSPLVKSFVSWIASNLGALVMQFEIAGGGASGFLSVLQLIAKTAGPVALAIGVVASAVKVLIERWGDIKTAVSNTLNQLGITEKLQTLQTKLDELAEKLGWVKGFWDGLKTSILQLMDLVGGTVVTVLGSILTGLINGAVVALSGLVTAVTGVYDIFAGFAEFIAGVFTLDMQRMDEGLTQMGEGIKETFAGLWEALAGGLAAFIEGFVAGFVNLGGTLLTDTIPAIAQGIKDWWNGIVEFFTEAVPQWWETTIVPWFSLEKWMELGQNALEGLFQGLASIGDAATQWGEGLIESVKNVLGIHSPSTVFESLGVYAVEGLQIGLSGLSFMPVLFGTQLTSMKALATTFYTEIKAMQDTALAEFIAALAAANQANAEAAEAIAAAYDEMAARSNSAIQSIIASLNAIPRSITTVHTIVTRHVSEGSSGGDTEGYASGGFPSAGQLFLAREAGPELVGTIGGRTAVANNDQIIQGIAQGVYEAMIRAAEATATEQQPIVVELDGAKVGRSVTNWQQRQGVSITKGAYANAY